MSGAKHTPGPWRVDPDYPGDVQTADGTLEIADVWNVDDWKEHACPPLAEALANAALIAAAPDLLRAVREADEYMSNFLTIDDPRWALVRAALAKAESGT